MIPTRTDDAQSAHRDETGSPGILRRPWILAANRSLAHRAAYIAALSLVAIQVSIGIIMKAAQTEGTYSFSTSGSVAISEFFKMLLSTGLFYRECKLRASQGVKPVSGVTNTEYRSLPVAEEPFLQRTITDDETSGEELRKSDDRSSISIDLDEADPLHIPFGPKLFWSYIRGEVTRDVRYGFCNLALFYVLINTSIFISYKLADPGTIQLTKSGVTLITALVMIATLDARISKIQWMAIIMQISGLVVTQYQPDTGSTYPITTYLILIFQVFLGATSGVYNQALIEADNASLHAGNMILYAAGSSISLICHFVIKLLKDDEPGFFVGYNSLSAILVIVSNVFIGLAITAVYKYADAVVKCFATAFATGILLYVTPMLFHTPLSAIVLPGTVTVFVATWLYMENPAPKNTTKLESNSKKRGLIAGLSVLSKRFSGIFFGTTAVLTITIVATLSMLQTTMPDFAKTVSKTPSTSNVQANKTIVTSPFKDTLGLVRWNSPHPERLPLVMKYKPFFKELHISMPESLTAEGLDTEFHNLTHDQNTDTFHIYNQVSRTMRVLLNEYPDIDGLLYFHFDAWIDPLAWNDMNHDHIHFPLVPTPAGDTQTGPDFRCMNDPKDYEWWGWGNDKIHLQAMAAEEQLDSLEVGYDVKTDEWCVGWSDIYYIPRRYFADYIFLADIFIHFGVWHEVAIPTMMRIIDDSRRVNPHVPIMEHISDCWGDCCRSNPTLREVLTYRCGHRLPYENQEVTNGFYDKIDNQTKILGHSLNGTWMPGMESFFKPLKNITITIQEDSKEDEDGKDKDNKNEMDDKGKKGEKEGKGESSH